MSFEKSMFLRVQYFELEAEAQQHVSQFGAQTDQPLIS